MGAALVLVGLLQPVTHIPETPAVIAERVPIHSVQEEKLNLKDPIALATTANIAVPKDNETIIWDYLTQQGFTRNQTAGIMGNLEQEHGFQTSDVPGGLGIAQWIDNRRDNLMGRPDYLSINTQLQFLMDELNSTGISNQIKSVDSIEHSVVTFQNQFERCGQCMEGNRISYAHRIAGSH